ncbi:MAG: hypothetical protein CSA35_05395 [Dethiosulfovibrio peptidovorans]|nr:MAG: hypothetical protein CSA35_05395 [Dethiosulfovibrio peptidovorans]
MASVLVVDSNLGDRKSVIHSLTSLGYSVETAESGEEALYRFGDGEYNLVLLGDLISEISRMEVLQEITRRSQQTPVIVVVHADEDDFVEQALEKGAWGWLIKPDIEERWIRHLAKQALAWASLQRDNQKYRYRMERLVESHTKEISQALQMRCSDHEHIDGLTGLPNRILFLDLLSLAIKKAKKENEMMSLFLCDIDHFTSLNVSLGYSVGNHILIAVAKRLSSLVTDGASVARIGSDSFALIVPGDLGRPGLFMMAEQIEDMFAGKISVGEHRVDLSLSCGVAVYPDDSKDDDEIFSNAEVALQSAKVAGKGAFRLFSQALSSEHKSYFQVSPHIQEALEQEEFELHYQPTVYTDTGEIGGMEALVRWRSSRLGRLVMPDEFISVAEDTGVITALGEWVLRKACSQVLHWLDEFPNLRLSVNISARQFSDPALVAKVEHVLNQTGFPASCLDLELTENALIRTEDRAVELLTQLVDQGIGISIDDFGTGYSSMTYLKQFPVRRLKMDKSFVSGLPEATRDRAIAEAVVNLGHALGKEVVAEGVDSVAQWSYLKTLGCDVLQGFLFSRPIPPDAFEALLRKGSFSESSF